MAARQNIVAFRIDDELLSKIDADCQQFSVPRAPWLRGIVSSHYSTTEQEALTGRLDELAGEVSRLIHDLVLVRQDLRCMLLALLKNVGTLDHREAKRCVAKAFSSEEM